MLVAISLLILLFPRQAEEKGKEITTTGSLTTEYEKETINFQTIFSRQGGIFQFGNNTGRSQQDDIGESEGSLQKDNPQSEIRQTRQEGSRAVLFDTPEITDGEDKEIDDGMILDKIQDAFKEETETALKILVCESNGNINAINWNDAKITGFPSMGLFQLNRPYDEKYFDPFYNITEAYGLYLKRGWQPWSCAKKLGIL